MAASIAASPRAARAEVLVLDTCVKRCTDEDLWVFGMFRRMLMTDFERPGLVADASKALAFMDGAPHSGIEDRAASARELADGLRRGVDHWINGRYEQAEWQLETALFAARRNPALVMSDPTLRQLIPRAQVGRAVSLLRLGRAELAKLAMAELVRTLPEQSILDSWGTEAEKIFQLARNDLDAQGKGSLLVEVDDPVAIFYINEAGEPHRSMFTATLYPGRYRVLVQSASGEHRRYEIAVAPHETTTLHLEWQRELEFASSGDHVGYTFRTAAERRREGEYARRLAALAHSQQILVIGLVQWRKRTAVIGTMYRVDLDEPYRIGIVPLADNHPQALHDLAAFLLSPGAPAGTVTQLAAPPWERRPDAAQGGSLIWYPIGWATAAGALAAGTSLVATDPTLRPSAGYVLLGLGLASGITTTVFFLRRDRGAGSDGGAAARSTAAVLLAPVRAGASVELVARF